MESNVIFYTPEKKEMQTFFAKTFTYFAGSLLVSGGTAYLVSEFVLKQFLTNPAAMPFSPMLVSIVFFGVYLALVFTSSKWAKVKGLAPVLFYLTVALSGVFLSGIIFQMLNSQTALYAGVAAFGSAAMLFSVMGVMWFTTKMDLSKYSTIAYAVLIALIIVWVINMFMGSSFIVLITSLITVPLFAFFTAYDFQNIKEGRFATPIEAALMLYIDFINLFVSLYNIIMSLVGED